MMIDIVIVKGHYLWWKLERLIILNPDPQFICHHGKRTWKNTRHVVSGRQNLQTIKQSF